MQATQEALREALPHAAAVQPGGELESAAEAYQALKKAVLKAKTCKEASLEELLGGFEPKVPVLSLLVEVHKRKALYKKQVRETLETLLQVGAWAAALRGDEALCADLPEELAVVLAAVPPCDPAAVAVPAPEAPAAPALGAVVVPVPAPAPVVLPVTPPAAPAIGGDVVVTDDALRAAITAAKEAGEQARSFAPRHSPREPAPREASGHLEEAMQGMARLRYKAEPRDDAVEAFTHLSKAVTMLAKERDREGEYSDDPFAAVEPKAEVAAFLLEVCAHKVYKSRVEAIFAKFWESPPWRETIEADVELFASIRRLFPGLGVQGSDRRPAPDIAALALAAEGRGAVGSLYVRVFGCHNLMNKDSAGKSDPFVSLRLGDAERRTDFLTDTLSPRWAPQNATFVFDVVTPEDVLHLTVFDKDFIGTELLGKCSLKVSDAPRKTSEPPETVCFKLSEAENGEVEVELALALTDTGTQLFPREVFKPAARGAELSGKAGPAGRLHSEALDVLGRYIESRKSSLVVVSRDGANFRVEAYGKTLQATLQDDVLTVNGLGWAPGKVLDGTVQFRDGALWTKEESCKAGADGHEEEGDAGLPSKRRWRWADLNPLAAHNPMRLSEWKTVDETAADLRALSQADQGRKLLIQVGDNRGNKIREFKAPNVLDGIDLLHDEAMTSMTGNSIPYSEAIDYPTGIYTFRLRVVSPRSNAVIIDRRLAAGHMLSVKDNGHICFQPCREFGQPTGSAETTRSISFHRTVHTIKVQWSILAGGSNTVYVDGEVWATATNDDGGFSWSSDKRDIKLGFSEESYWTSNAVDIFDFVASKTE